MDTFELIKTRRSIRQFTDEPVSDEVVDKVIEAGIWAPSGKNNQPWRFAVIRDKELKAKISGLTQYSKIVLSADLLIAVFLDESLSYDRTKDTMAIGASIENMLLMIHSIGLGAVWLGQILKSRDELLALLGNPEGLELMAVIAIGHPASAGKEGIRTPLDDTIFFRK